jgi:hypothetical protein
MKRFTFTLLSESEWQRIMSNVKLLIEIIFWQIDPKINREVLLVYIRCHLCQDIESKSHSQSTEEL